MIEHSFTPKPLAPEKIEYCDPTLVNQLAKCIYQAAFKRDTNFDYLQRVNPFLLRGTVVHSVREKSPNKLLDVPDENFRDAFNEIWESEMKVQHQRLVDDWSPASVPDFEDWPEYRRVQSRTRINVKKEIQRIIDSREGGERPVVEGWFEDERLKLKGKPDRVETWDSQTVAIVDIKTGPDQGEIRPEQRRQLLFYAHLFKASNGQTPKKIVVENTRGERSIEDITDSDIDTVVEEILELRNNFNSALEGNLETFATPSKESCQHCPYRSHCDPFWSAYDKEWSEWKISISGKVKEITEEEVAVHNIISPSGIADSEIKFLRPKNFQLNVGDSVVVIDAKPSFLNSEVITLEWNSLINDTPVSV